MMRFLFTGLIALCLTSGALAARPAVFTTSYALAYFAERLGGDALQVILADDITDTRSWTPSIADIQTMQAARLVLISDPNQEPWLDRVALPARRIVNTSAAVHDQLIPVGNAVTHTHGPDGEHSHVASAANPWLDLRLAAAQAGAIAEAMKRQRLGNAEQIDARLQRLERDLHGLDETLLAASDAEGGVPVLAVSADYAYFARRYGLRIRQIDLNHSHDLKRALDSRPAEVGDLAGGPGRRKRPGTEPLGHHQRPDFDRCQAPGLRRLPVAHAGQRRCNAASVGRLIGKPGDPVRKRMCAGIVDRLLLNATVVRTLGGHRMRRQPTQAPGCDQVVRQYPPGQRPHPARRAPPAGRR